MNKNTLKNSALAIGLVAFGMVQANAVEAASEKRDLDTFTGVLVEGAMSLEITVGESQSVTVKTEDGYLDRVETTVEDGILIIDQKGRKWRDIDVEITISMSSLDSLTVEGAADADVSGISSDNFVVEIDGAADLTLEGSCVKSKYSINGAGDINAKEFICEDVNVEINGAGDADVYASESIVATLNGIGDVTVYGDPSSIRPRINGLGSFDMK